MLTRWNEIRSRNKWPGQEALTKDEIIEILG